MLGTTGSLAASEHRQCGYGSTRNGHTYMYAHAQQHSFLCHQTHVKAHRRDTQQLVGINRNSEPPALRNNRNAHGTRHATNNNAEQNTRTNELAYAMRP